MYLTKLQIENVGPFGEALTLELPFNQDHTPQPLILVGKNGTGKTTMLAHVVDALHEFSAQHFQDSLPKEGHGYAYFKICGSTNQRTGSEYGFCALQFEHDGHKFLYLDKSGKLTKQGCESKWGTPIGLDGWIDDKYFKLTTKSDEFKNVFGHGAYAYFPVHRNEPPSWLNSENSTIRGQFSVKRRFAGILAKPFVVLESSEPNRTWLLDLVLDHALYKDATLLDAANDLLRGILGRNDVRFGVGPRMGQTRVAICNESGNIVVPTTSHLSGGQAALLNLALTILRYGDQGQSTKLDQITGIVVIDEIESHLHAQLQTDLLPKLLKQFPKIQFLITSHSPIFLMGMEKNWPEKGFEIRQLPNGAKMTAKDFSEYEAISNSLSLVSSLKTLDKEFVVFVEGQTDKIILEAAWSKLRPGKECSCAFTNAYDCNLIRNTLKRDEVFNGSPAKTFIGLLDFDSAFDAWNGAANGGAEKWIIDPSNVESIGILATHPRHKGYIALLPVPDFRSMYASMKFGGDSSVSIELLFPDAIITNYVVARDLPGGGKSLKFRDDQKVAFAATVPNIPASEFAAFEPVVRLIEDIISGARGKRSAASPAV